jgi:HEPN domain-containing protein
MFDQTEYWYKESFESYDTAKVLSANKKYLESAFFCHLSIEKMLKAHIAKKTGELPPKSHNLLYLIEQTDLKVSLNDDQLDFFSNLTLYQLEGRYPGDRTLLYKQTTVTEFEQILKRTGVELKWLKQMLKLEQS